MTDNGVRALAERIPKAWDSAVKGRPGATMAESLSIAILANGAAFKAAEEYEEMLVYIDGLSTALSDLVLWLEAEVAHPRPDPHPAMRLQASIARAALQPEGSAGT